MQALLKVSLRQQALFIPESALSPAASGVLEGPITSLVGHLAKAGYVPSEPLLQALKRTAPAYQETIWRQVRDTLGLDRNWAPLVKGWDRPTGETRMDHLLTWFTNLFGGTGTKLPCGHVIPKNTFPLERYNGCPFCGTPFERSGIEHYGQGSNLKVLQLWTEKEAEAHLSALLSSKTALDATAADSLKLLLSVWPVPEVPIAMKETLVLVADTLIAQDKGAEAGRLFRSPADILRYLWYRHTGFLLLIGPKELIRRTARNNRHLFAPFDTSAQARLTTAASLKLKYSRKEARMVAGWINGLPLSAEQVCEMMHPKRGMWVRFIRALRLGEYSKRKGFEKLRHIMDLFYHETYPVWQGAVDTARLRYRADETFALLQQRPGLFARSLFANMLWFGAESTTKAFGEVIHKVPARLVLTLNMYAATYFDPASQRVVKPVGGNNKTIPANRLLSIYDEAGLEAMQEAVKDLSLRAMQVRFAAQATASRSVYIDPALYRLPLSIGDRSETVQDTAAALMGTRFAAEGDSVRLFMHWGKDMEAQHLDMDLSCVVSYGDRTETCSYMRLVATGCKHSGDIRQIPSRVGTAEYIEMNLPELEAAGARYVTFSCNAYSQGAITPHLVVGWMSSAFPMRISPTSGVAYDPSCVQHQVRVTKSLAKGLVFGVLDVIKREIIWLEMPFAGQVAQNMDGKAVRLFLRKLESKLTVGQLLDIKAAAQGLAVVPTKEADEVYDTAWALDAAAVTALFAD